MWKAGLDRATELQGAGRGVVLLTEVTAVRGGSWPACSPVFAILDGGLAQAGPLQKWGIPASICAGGEDAVLWGREQGCSRTCFTGRVTAPLSLHLPPRVGTGRQTAAYSCSGGWAF